VEDGDRHSKVEQSNKEPPFVGSGSFRRRVNACGAERLRQPRSVRRRQGRPLAFHGLHSQPAEQCAADGRCDDPQCGNLGRSAKLADQPLPWANAATGSAGVVTAIHEDKSSGFVCRDFRTTRHSFEGVASYSGQACLSETGEWLLTRFEQK